MTENVPKRKVVEFEMVEAIETVFVPRVRAFSHTYMILLEKEIALVVQIQ